MALVQVMIVASGGSVAALAVSALLGKSLISQLLACEMEALRSRLKIDGDTLLESLESRLQQDVSADQRQFDRAQVMARYQGPLLRAAYDLQSRHHAGSMEKCWSRFSGGWTRIRTPWWFAGEQSSMCSIP